MFPNQLGKILLFVTSYEKCDVSKRQLILKSVTLYVKIRKNLFIYFALQMGSLLYRREFNNESYY
jgi:hypothetical protein